jgi:hypothetical protein
MTDIEISFASTPPLPLLERATLDQSCVDKLLPYLGSSFSSTTSSTTSGSGCSISVVVITPSGTGIRSPYEVQDVSIQEK